MKKFLVWLLILMCFVSFVSADAEVCVVADFGAELDDEPMSECIEIDEGKNGYELLNELGWDLVWTPETAYGHMLCKIDDIGTDVSGSYCAYSGEFWNLVLARDGEWLHMPVGLDGPGGCWNYDANSWDGHYCTKDGDVLAFSFGAAGAEPDMFRFNVTKVYVDGEKETRARGGGGKIRDVFPESKVDFKLELENFYHHSTDIDINDISIIATIEEIDDGDDIEEELDEFDLSADKEKTEMLEFEIPLEVDAKDRLLIIEMEAEDDAGIKYEAKFTYDLEVEKEKHNLRITGVGLNKESYVCGDNVLLHVSVMNLGSEEEDVNLRILNDELDLDISENFELSDEAFELSSKFDKRFSLWVPDDVIKGTYSIPVTVGYGTKEEIETVDLVVSSCSKEASVETVDGEESTSVEVIGGVDSGAETGKGSVKLISGQEGVVEYTTGGNMSLVLTGLLVFLFVVILVLGVFAFMLKRR